MIDPKNDFDRKFQSITGINYSVTDLIEKATDDKAKAELYYKLSWKVARGTYLANPESDLFKLFAEVIEGLQSKLNISGKAEDVDNDSDVDLDDAKVNKETQFIEDIKNSTLEVEETSDDDLEETSDDVSDDN